MRLTHATQPPSRATHTHNCCSVCALQTCSGQPGMFLPNGADVHTTTLRPHCPTNHPSTSTPPVPSVHPPCAPTAPPTTQPRPPPPVPSTHAAPPPPHQPPNRVHLRQCRPPTETRVFSSVRSVGVLMPRQYSGMSFSSLSMSFISTCESKSQPPAHEGCW
eukprot:295938-Chlamydomonas_euryale.AAC.6